MPKRTPIQIGETINNWIILENLGVVNNYRTVLAKCVCGKVKTLTYTRIKNKRAVSCGCLKPKHWRTTEIQDINQYTLKLILNYDPDTGYFTWMESRSSTAAAKDIAGCIDGDGYVVIGINGKSYKASVLAWIYMYGVKPKKEIDHINRIRNDNRICNLREATKSEQQLNKNVNKNSTSGYKWVLRDNERGGWKVQSRFLGGFHKRFDNKDDAIIEARRMQEYVAKHGALQRGKKSPYKLTQLQVQEILTSSESSYKLAKKFNVCTSTVCRIRNGKTKPSLNRNYDHV